MNVLIDHAAAVAPVNGAQRRGDRPARVAGTFDDMFAEAVAPAFTFALVVRT
jgi:hypothetical protein